MPCKQIKLEQDTIIEELQQYILDSLDALLQLKDPKRNAILVLVLYVKEQKQHSYTTKDDEWKAFYLGLHKYTTQPKTPPSGLKQRTPKHRTRRRRTRRHRVKKRIVGGIGSNIRLCVIVILLCIVGLVESAIGTTAKSLTAEQIDKAFTGKYSLRSLYMQLALANDSGFCHPLSQLATSPKPFDSTIGPWAATKTPDKIARQLDFSEETKYDAALERRVKSQAHTSDYDLYGEPNVVTGFSSLDNMKHRMDAAANTIYEHWSRNVGVRTGDTICLFRISVANTDSGFGHTFVGMVRMMSGKLLHGYIDSNRFGNLVFDNSYWLYVDAGFFDTMELSKLDKSVVVSDNPLSSLLDTFPSFSLEDPSKVKLEVEDNSNKYNNSPAKPGSFFPVFGYTTTEYIYLLKAKDTATKVILAAYARSHGLSSPTMINPFD